MIIDYEVYVTLPVKCKFRPVDNGRLGQINGRLHVVMIDWPNSGHGLLVTISNVVTADTICRRTTAREK